MKFHCLCLSPAIDATVTLPCAPRGEGEIFKDVHEVETVGGKGLNVARWLAIRGASVTCGGLLGRDNAAPFEKELAKYGIEDRFLRVPGSTRRNEMITWPGGSMKLNRAAFDLLEKIGCEQLNWQAAIGKGDVAILSGSLPKCCESDFYASCILALKAKGVIVVLDASGAALKAGFEAGPDIIKPNAEECEALVGFVPRTPDDFRRATEVLKAKVGCPIISDGGNGCWFDGEFVPAPQVEVVDTTAAGDTLLAEWCWRHFGEGLSPLDAAYPAVAAGSAACTMPGSAPPALVADFSR